MVSDLRCVGSQSAVCSGDLGVRLFPEEEEEGLCLNSACCALRPAVRNVGTVVWQTDPLLRVLTPSDHVGEEGQYDQ